MANRRHVTGTIAKPGFVHTYSRTPLKRKANTSPTSKPEQLKLVWDRMIAVYQPCIVKVTGRRGTMLSFALYSPVTGEEATRAGRPFVVDLDDGAMVFGDLPSTAQLVKPGSKKRYGFLMLSEAFFLDNLDAFNEPVSTRQWPERPTSI